ncbi:MAG: hypothetical protein ACN6O6_15745 [Pseudomonas sp.]|uniref:hypothetical protein n=1 Tax=Pseudomonas sp. TaxID=306 RepID=UPI003D138CED
MSTNKQPNPKGTNPAQEPTTHEPPAKNERPDKRIQGEQPRSRSNEGDPENPPD